MAKEMKKIRERSPQALEKTYQNFLKEVEKEIKIYERHGVNIGEISTDFFDFKTGREALITSGRYDKKRKNIARQLAEEFVQPYTQKQFDALMAGFYKEQEVEVDGMKKTVSVMNQELRIWLEDTMGYDDKVLKMFDEKDVKTKDKRAKFIKLLQETYAEMKRQFPELVDGRHTAQFSDLISEYFFGS